VDLTIIQRPSNEGRAGTQSLVPRCDVDVDMDRIAEGIFERRLGHLKRVMDIHCIVARSSKACVVECRHNGYTSGTTWQADGNDHQGSEKDQMQGSVKTFGPVHGSTFDGPHFMCKRLFLLYQVALFLRAKKSLGSHLIGRPTRSVFSRRVTEAQLIFQTIASD